MPRGCAIPNCNNRANNKEKWVILPHVTKLSFHTCKDPNHLLMWKQLVCKGGIKQESDSPPLSVCSNHFPLGQPLPSSPFPTMYLRGYSDLADQQTVSHQSAVSVAKELDHAYTDFKTCRKKKLVKNVRETDSDKRQNSPHDLVKLCCSTGIECSHSKKEEHYGNLSSVPKSAVDYDVPNNLEVYSSSFSHQKGTYADLFSKQTREKPPNNKSKPGRQTVVKKRMNRNTDHIYNARKARPVEEVFVRKVNNRDTDHLYNLRKAETKVDFVSPNQISRDTDHMYNIRDTGTRDVQGRFASKSDCCLSDGNKVKEAAVGDKRVVDKDHMYQHSIRKNRNRSENKTIEAKREHQHSSMASKKRKAVKANDSSHVKKRARMKDLPSEDENSLSSGKILAENKTSTCVAKQITEVQQDAKVMERTCSVIMDFPTVVDPTVDSDHLISQESVEEVASASPSTATVPSPAHSGDSDHVCEDDSRMTGAWHTDHLYVHADYLDNVILEAKVQPVLTPCVSADGYKQEHSYANSEEHRYDACVNCSQLVQQLIGTIHQQGDQIDILRKKLRAANAKIKQLSLLSAHQEEMLE